MSNTTPASRTSSITIGGAQEVRCIIVLWRRARSSSSIAIAK